MTPKEKAKELVDKFKQYSWMSYTEGFEETSIKESAKQCALIAVDEIMKVLNGYDFYYWQEVKQEIEKL